VDLVLEASEIEERHCLSFWDALIIAAARRSGAKKVLSEDLNAGQLVSGVRIENPFLGAK
jgi:predicted nucleic acid-binding protein